MTKFSAFALANIAMLVALPFNSLLATKADAPLYTHFVYMFAHADILHWAINAWAILAMHRIISVRMAAVAYIAAVILSFFAKQPTVGASAMVFFVFGCLTPTLLSHRKIFLLQIIIYLAVAFLLPGVAAGLHCAAYIVGIIYIGAHKTAYQIKRIFDENNT